MIDATDAVLIDGCEVALIGAVRDGTLDEMPSLFVIMRGRINKTSERSQIGYLMNEDGAAALVTEIMALATRAGWGQEFMDRVQARLEAMP